MSNCNDGEEKPKIKLILLGDSYVGKTSLINVAIGKLFNENEENTIIPSFCVKQFKINGISYDLALWDTLGSEKNKSLSKIFFKNAKIAILVYDITCKDTLDGLNDWFENLKELEGEEITLGVAGNKSDLYDQEQVSEEEGENFAKSINARFSFTSAKSNPSGFVQFIEQLLIDYIHKEEKVEDNIDDNISIKLNKKNKNLKERKMCSC